MPGMTRSPLILPAVVAALALGACGGSDDDGGGSSASSRQDKAFEGALKFAKCMRENGIDMPDPKFSGSGGGVTFQLGTGSRNGSSGGPNPDSPAFKAADKVCHSKLAGLGKGGPGGDGPSTD